MTYSILKSLFFSFFISFSSLVFHNFVFVSSKSALLGVGISNSNNNNINSLLSNDQINQLLTSLSDGGSLLPKDMTFDINTENKTMTRLMGHGMGIDMNMIEMILNNGVAWKLYSNQVEFKVDEMRYIHSYTSNDVSSYANDQLLYQWIMSNANTNSNNNNKNQGHPNLNLHSLLSLHNDLIIKLSTNHNDIITNLCIAEMISLTSPILTSALETKLRHDCESKYAAYQSSLSMLHVLELISKNVYLVSKNMEQGNQMISKSMSGMNLFNKTMTATINALTQQFKEMDVSIEKSTQDLHVMNETYSNLLTTELNTQKEFMLNELKIGYDYCDLVNQTLLVLLHDQGSNLTHDLKEAIEVVNATIIDQYRIIGENLTIIKDSFMTWTNGTFPSLMIEFNQSLTSSFEKNLSVALSELESSLLTQFGKNSQELNQSTQGIANDVLELKTLVDKNLVEVNTSIESLQQEIMLNFREYGASNDALIARLNESFTEGLIRIDADISRINDRHDILKNASDIHALQLVEESHRREDLREEIGAKFDILASDVISLAKQQSASDIAWNESVALLEASIDEHVANLSQNISIVLARTNSVLANVVHDVNITLTDRTHQLAEELTNRTEIMATHLQVVALKAFENATNLERILNESMTTSMHTLTALVNASFDIAYSNLTETRRELTNIIANETSAAMMAINETRTALNISELKLHSDIEQANRSLMTAFLEANDTIVTVNNTLHLQMNQFVQDLRNNDESINASFTEAMQRVNASLFSIQSSLVVDVGSVSDSLSGAKILFNSSLTEVRDKLQLGIDTLNTTIRSNGEVAQAQLNQTREHLLAEIIRAENRTNSEVAQLSSTLQLLNQSSSQSIQHLNASFAAGLGSVLNNSTAEVRKLEKALSDQTNITREMISSVKNTTIDAIASTNSALNATESKLLLALQATSIQTSANFSSLMQQVLNLTAAMTAADLAANATASSWFAASNGSLYSVRDSLALDIKRLGDNVSTAQSQLAESLLAHIRNVSDTAISINVSLSHKQTLNQQSLVAELASLNRSMTSEFVISRNALISQSQNQTSALNLLAANMSSLNASLLSHMAIGSGNNSVVVGVLAEHAKDIKTLGSNFSAALTALGHNLTQALSLSRTETSHNISTLTIDWAKTLQQLNVSFLTKLTELGAQHNLSVVTSRANSSAELQFVNKSIDMLNSTWHLKHLDVSNVLDMHKRASEGNHSILVAQLQGLHGAVSSLNSSHHALEKAWNNSVAEVYKKNSALTAALESDVKELLSNFSIANTVKLDLITDEYRHLRGLQDTQFQRVQELRGQADNTTFSLALTNSKVQVLEESFSQLRNATVVATGSLQEMLSTLKSTELTSQLQQQQIASVASKADSIRTYLDNATLHIERLKQEQMSASDLIQLFANLTNQASAKTDALLIASRDDWSKTQQALQQQLIDHAKLTTRVDGTFAETIEGHTKAISQQRDDLTTLQSTVGVSLAKLEYAEESVKLCHDETKVLHAGLSNSSAHIMVLQSRDAAAADKISSLEQTVKSLEQTLAVQTSKLNEAQTLLDSQYAKIAKLEAESESLRRSVASQNDVNDLRKLVLDLQTTLVGHTGKVLEVVSAAYANPPSSKS